MAVARPKSTPTPLRAAIYCRISSDREELKLGIKRQEKDCRSLCNAEGWTVDDSDVYIDNDISAADPSKTRPASDRLVRAIRARKADVVVVAVEDRLHRQPAELEEFVAICGRAKMRLLASPRGGQTRLDDPDALFLLRIKGNMAAREIDVLRRRVQRKHQELAEQGKYHGGRRPFGCHGVPIPSCLLLKASDLLEESEGLLSADGPSGVTWREHHDRPA